MIIGAAAVVCAGLSAATAPHGRVLHPHELGVIRIAAEDPDPVSVALLPVAGPPGSSIDLHMKVPMPGLRFAIFREIAPDIAFTLGFRMRNSWIVGIGDLEKVQITVPPKFEGTVLFEVQFHGVQGAAAARGIMAVNVNKVTVPSEPQQPEVHPTTPVVGTLSKQERLISGAPRSMGVSSKEEEEELVRGRKLVAGGDIATARLIFQNLTFRGSALAARFLAETFDPRVLSRMPVAGLHPDIVTARKWYRIAADAGDSESATRLNLLAQQ